MTIIERAQSCRQSVQYLTFEIAGETYAVEILKVQEVRGWQPVREMPNAPDFIQGALNLRGSIVPIIDLRQRFNLGNTECSPLTVVIVVRMQIERTATLMGIIADAVSDVLNVDPAEIRNTPNLGKQIDTRYMRGMYLVNDKMVLLLDVDKLFDSEVCVLPGKFS